MENQNQQGGSQYQQPPQQTIIVMGQNKKSTGVAFILSFFFGPLGLLYASVTGGLIMLVISIPVALFTLGFGLIVTNIICVVWAIMAVNNHNNKASNPQQFPTQQQQFQQPNIVSPPVQTVNPVQTPQPISEIKSEPIPTQLQQPLQTSQTQQPAFNYGEWFEKNKKTVFIGTGSVLGLVLLLVAIKFLLSLNFKNNTERENSNNSVILQDSSINKTQSSMAENQFIVDTYLGTIGKKDFKLFIEKVDGENVEGYNVTGTNRRPLKGRIVNKWTEPTGLGGDYTVFKLILTEPGDDKWDGEFNIDLYISDQGRSGKGSWKSFNGKLEHNIVIKDRLNE